MSITPRAVKYCLYPTHQPDTLLDRQFEVCRELYNTAFTERRQACLTAVKSINYLDPDYYDQANRLKELRTFHFDFYAINFSGYQNVLHRLDRGFKALVERIKRGEKSRFRRCRYRGKNRYKSVTRPGDGDGSKLKSSGLVYLQGISNIRFEQQRHSGSKGSCHYS